MPLVARARRKGHRRRQPSCSTSSWTTRSTHKPKHDRWLVRHRKGIFIVTKSIDSRPFGVASADCSGLSRVKNLHTMPWKGDPKLGPLSGYRVQRGAGESKIMFEYEPFTDSTEHQTDGEALRARLAEDGYLFLRRLLPREAILNVRARLLRRRAGGWPRTRPPASVSPIPPPPARTLSRAICRCFAASGRTRRCIACASILG